MTAVSLLNGRKGSAGAEGELTVIGAEAHFQGIMTLKGSLRVEGAVEGDVRDATSVQVGAGGRVQGTIAAETVSIAGQVSGEVVASRQIEVLASGRVSGRIRTPKLRIEEGAVYDGECAMAGDGARDGARDPARKQAPAASKA